MKFKGGYIESEESMETNNFSRTNSTRTDSSDQFNDSESESSVTELQERSDTMTVPSYAQCKHGNQVAVVGACISALSKRNSNGVSSSERLPVLREGVSSRKMPPHLSCSF